MDLVYCREDLLHSLVHLLASWAAFVTSPFGFVGRRFIAMQSGYAPQLPIFLKFRLEVKLCRINRELTYILDS